MILLCMFFGFLWCIVGVVWCVFVLIVGVVSFLGWIVLGLVIVLVVIVMFFGWLEFFYLGFMFGVGLFVVVVFLIGCVSFCVMIELILKWVVVG